LADALRTLPDSTHPDLLVGFNKADDAGVYRITDRQALVQTVDFFPPIVDDPYHFGQIAAANAISDVYAMGGRPLTALNIVAFPSDKMPLQVLTEILRGGTDKINEAGATVLGGHSIKDNELKYGVAVTGLVDIDRIVTNAGARPNDKLFLTKPLGTGLITTGIKRLAVGPELEAIVSHQMAQLNKAAAELMVRFDVHAATDITGYGLLGHSFEIAEASNVTIRISSHAVPLMPQALELADAGMIPGGGVANREWLTDRIRVSDSVPHNLEVVMFDPQTSGGLLMAIPDERVADFQKEAELQKTYVWMVGQVETRGDFSLLID